MSLHTRQFNVILVLAFLCILISCGDNTEQTIIKLDDSEVLSDIELAHNQLGHIKQSTNKEVYYFGFDLRASPQKDASQYVPFLNYLSEATGYLFKLHFTPKSSSTIEELAKSHVQFAAMGASGFLKAQQRMEVASLVRGLNHQGKAEYQSLFVTRPDSRINNIAQIKNKRLAFGSTDSTQGHLIPRIMLSKQNIGLKDLKSHTYTGSHQNCAEAVVSGKFDVCGMQDELAKRLANEGQLKIIHHSVFYPSSGIVALKSLPADVIEKVRTALLAFDPINAHRKNLHNWDKTEMPRGFVEAKETDYQELKDWSTKLGFLAKN